MGLRQRTSGPEQLAVPAAPQSPSRRRRSQLSAEEQAEQERDADRRLEELEVRLGIKFKRRAWLVESMTHTSWINERGAAGRDNERLEYLGDAVLELVAAEYLFNRFPNYDEGQLTQMRSSLVSTVALAGIGEQLRLGEALRLGRGATKSGARRLTSLHANAFEAIIGATFLDQGYKKAGRIFLSRIGDLSSWTDPNFKGRLQALAQERFGGPPLYLTLADGNVRPRQYVSQVSVEGGPVLGEGRGSTKQVAEQGAARAAIDGLVAPAPKPRRRRSRSTLAAAAIAAEIVTPAASAVVAAEVTQVLSEGSVAEPVVPPRRRRRRARSSGAGPEALGVAPPEVVVSPEAPLAEGQPQGVQPNGTAAPRRRRRRSRGGGGGSSEVPAADPGQGSEEALGASVATSGPSQPAAPAPPRPRRRSTRGGSGASATVAPATAPHDPESGPADPVDPTQRKRTHRGRRGGRRRSGRPADPTP
ncbi:MAG: ribonuclease III [Candidatus Dormibacteria bacterium]